MTNKTLYKPRVIIYFAHCWRPEQVTKGCHQIRDSFSYAQVKGVTGVPSVVPWHVGLVAKMQHIANETLSKKCVYPEARIF